MSLTFLESDADPMPAVRAAIDRSGWTRIQPAVDAARSAAAWAGGDVLLLFRPIAGRVWVFRATADGRGTARMAGPDGRLYRYDPERAYAVLKPSTAMRGGAPLDRLLA